MVLQTSAAQMFDCVADNQPVFSRILGAEKRASTNVSGDQLYIFSGIFDKTLDFKKEVVGTV